MDSPDLVALLTLFNAAVSDDAKDKRVKEILQARLEYEQKIAQAEEEQQKAGQILTEARDQRMAGERAMAIAEQREARLKAFEATLAQVNDQIQREKAAWEAIRQRVDAEQAERRDQLAALASSLSEREADVTLRELTATKTEAALRDAVKAHSDRMRRLRAAWDGDEKDPAPSA